MSGSTIKDRHLKKIYDCLNIGSNKKAVQEVDRLPKNVKDQTVFKALKSLALIRMQKTLQAFEILDEIDLEANLDEVTLQTMTSCCKESVNVGKIVEMYEAASKRKPNDVDIMSHLFMAYVRVFNFKRQKEVALQMYKNLPTKKRLHSFWAIMSLFMQSQANKKPGEPDSPDSRVCLSLAEKMCEKMIEDERTQEEIELYLMILAKQNKHEEEYKFLTGPINSRITDHLSWNKRRQAYLCLDLKMYSRAFKHYFPTLIQDYPDQLEYYQGLFKSAFLLDTEAPSQQQPVAIADQQTSQTQSNSGTPVKLASALAECFDIVEKQCQLCLDSQDPLNKDQQQKSVKSQPKNLSRTSSLNQSRRGLLRGPFMAKAELYDMILSNESTLPRSVHNLCKSQFASKYSKQVTLYIEFFQLFSKKFICFLDLDWMLNKHNLSIEDKKELLIEIEGWINDISKSSGDVKPIDLFHIRLNFNLLKHALRDYKTTDSTSDRIKLAKEMMELYDDNRNFAKDLSCKTEFLPADYYCLLAINAIMTSSIDNEMLYLNLSQPILTDNLILSLIVMAENAFANSPSNHQIKLILLKLYSLIGVSKQSAEVLISIDIKHFQIDTLGHLLNPVLYNTGNYNLSKESLDTCLGFYAHGIRECFECLTTSYREGRFSRIDEISNVMRRLSDSLNAAQCYLLKGIVNNVTSANQDDIIQAGRSFDPFRGLHKIFRESNDGNLIKDSRDFKVLRSLHFDTNSLVQQRQQQTLEDERLWMKLRFYLMRSAFSQFELFVVNNKQQIKKKLREEIHLELELGSKVVEELMPQIKEIIAEQQDVRYSYLEPEASPFRWKNLPFESLVNACQLVVFRKSSSELSQQVLEKYSEDLNVIGKNAEQQIASINSLISMKQALSVMTLSLEFLSLCVTSLVALNYSGSSANDQTSTTTTTSSSNHNNTNPSSSAKTSTNYSQQPSGNKNKSFISQMMSRTEVQLLKLSKLLRGFDLKAVLLDKVSQVNQELVSKSTLENVETRDGLLVKPLMKPDALGTALSGVKEKVFDSYNESLKEIDAVCRRKIELLNSKT